MSANRAEKQLIDILVTAAVVDAEKLPRKGTFALTGGMPKKTEERLREECRVLGTLLWAENYGYYNLYYREAHIIPEYVFEPEYRAPHVVLAAVELFSDAIDEDSQAVGTCDLIRRQLVGKLPVIEDEMGKLRHLI